MTLVDSNFDTAAEEDIQFSQLFEGAIVRGSRKGLRDLRKNWIRTTLNARRIRSSSIDRRLNQDRPVGPRLTKDAAWPIEETSDGVSMRIHPANRTKVNVLERGRDPAIHADPETTMTFVNDEGKKITIEAQDMNPRDEKYSGWLRQAIRRWLANGTVSDNVSNEIEELMLAVYTS